MWGPQKSKCGQDPLRTEPTLLALGEKPAKAVAALRYYEREMSDTPDYTSASTKYRAGFLWSAPSLVPWLGYAMGITRSQPPYCNTYKYLFRAYFGFIIKTSVFTTLKTILT